VNKIILIALVFLFISCEFRNEVYQATGVFINSKNIKIGTVEVIEQGTGSNFRVQLETLTPGFYAMHIHEKALCDTPDFTSAGGHHGPRSDETFPGDFRPIHVKNEVSRYTGKLKKFNQIIFLRGIFVDPESDSTILDKDGSSIIVHTSSDGGARIACAKIKKKN
jgi:Cu-Zn family superoxide dismutase